MRLFRFGVQETLSSQEEKASPKGASREQRPEDKSEDKQKRVEQELWWKPFWTLSSLVIFIMLVWGAGYQAWQWLDRPVSVVQVEGKVRHLDRAKLAQDVAGNIEHSLLELDIKTVQALVGENPWVRVAGIKRDWPSTLIISVEEEVPVARWGERGLLNHQGDIFWPELKAEYRSLPRLSGPAPDTERVMSQFHDLNQMFRTIGLSVVSLDLEARGAWQLELDNNIKVVVGREAVNERLGRFLDLYQLRLAPQADQIEQIDIRYTHGVAVKWRPKAESENAG